MSLDIQVQENMEKIEQYYIVGEEGIHARPSGLIVKACKTYSFNVNFESENGEKGNGSSILSLICLGVFPGDLLKVIYTLPSKDNSDYFELMNHVNILEQYIGDVVQNNTFQDFEKYILTQPK